MCLRKLTFKRAQSAQDALSCGMEIDLKQYSSSYFAYIALWQKGRRVRVKYIFFITTQHLPVFLCFCHARWRIVTGPCILLLQAAPAHIQCSGLNWRRTAQVFCIWTRPFITNAGPSGFLDASVNTAPFSPGIHQPRHRLARRHVCDGGRRLKQ